MRALIRASEMEEVMTPEQIYNEAKAAAKSAVAAIVHQENINAMDCGFAWVTIPGNSPLAKWCRSAKIGRKGYPSGWTFWNPGEHRGQSIHIIEAGAKTIS